MSSEDPEVAEALVLLAHDLKNPLAAVLTNLSFVRGFIESLDDANALASELTDAREAVSDAALACESLQRFVSNLELVARDLGAKAREIEAPPLDLAAIADEVVGRQRASAESRNLTLSAAGSAWARGDRDLVVRAVDNLVANAVQHAPARTQVVLEIDSTDKEARITVLDQGIAVPAPMRDDATTRAGQARAKGRPEARYGRGLGLHAAAIAARAAGGSLVLGSRDDRSSLTLALPRLDE
ncbi:MAG: sensor histidine kinase [Polyangiales bacterium]